MSLVADLHVIVVVEHATLSIACRMQRLSATPLRLVTIAYMQHLVHTHPLPLAAQHSCDVAPQAD